jgi:hypothetical protein
MTPRHLYVCCSNFFCLILQLQAKWAGGGILHRCQVSVAGRGVLLCEAYSPRPRATSGLHLATGLSIGSIYILAGNKAAPVTATQPVRLLNPFLESVLQAAAHVLKIGSWRCLYCSMIGFWRCCILLEEKRVAPLASLLQATERGKP